MADPDPRTDARGLRFAGAAFIIAGLSYISLVVVLLTVFAGGLPTSGADLLHALGTQRQLIQTAIVSFIIKDLLVLMALPTLFRLLEQTTHPWRNVAVAVSRVLVTVALLLDLLSGLLVIALAHWDGTATEPAYLATAEYFYQYVWVVETPFIVAVLSLPVVVMSLVMTRSAVFNKPTAYLGVALGVVGVAATLFGLIQPVLLLALWYVSVGTQLLRSPTNRSTARAATA
jgi:hypothetical protein